MASLAGSVYDRLPSPLQTVAVNVYGLGNARRKRAWERIISELLPSESWTFEEQKSYVANQLCRVLQSAVNHVPRYMSLRHLANDLRDPSLAFDVLREFPVVTKAEILDEPDAYLSTDYRLASLTYTITSGTTGTPFKRWLERDALLLSDALWWRRTVWAGYRTGDWIARLVGDPIVPLSVRDPKQPWRRSLTDRRLYLSTYHLSRQTAPLMAEALARFRPQFLMGYPSALHALTQYIDSSSLCGWSPKWVLFSSEPLYEHQRSVITDFFNVGARGLYGCAERIVSAAECEAGAYHLSLVDGYVEGQFDASEGCSVPPITGLIGLAMPLIRFVLGDRIQVYPERQCGCGRTLPQISPVVTKDEDSIKTPTGRLVSPSILTWAFKDINGLEKSQVAQTSSDSVEVRLQGPVDAVDTAASVLRERIESLLFHEMTVRLRHVESLSITRAGKTRFVVNECDHEKGGGSPEEELP